MGEYCALTAGLAWPMECNRRREVQDSKLRKAPPSPFFGCDFSLMIVRRHERSCLSTVKEKTIQCLQLPESPAKLVERSRATFWPVTSQSELWCATSVKANPGHSLAATSCVRISITLGRSRQHSKGPKVCSCSFRRTSIRRRTFTRRGRRPQR